MSRAEKKLAKLKAEEELRKLKAEKRERQRQEREKNQQQWKELPEGVKTTIKFFGVILLLFVVIGAFSPSGNSTDQASQSADVIQATEATESEKSAPKTEQEKMLDSIIELMDSKDAFDTGSYVKGDVPSGEYAFMPIEGGGQYYSEEDSAGNIVDNENFDSFGYVYVQGAGNIQTRGVLIRVDAFSRLGAKSAKEIYEKLNDVDSYKDSAMYKVGVDIAPGTHTIQSYGEGYVEVMSGPVGNSEIIDNEIFNGKYSVGVSGGQYLKISRGKLL